MKIDREELVELYKELGVEVADKWDAEKMAGKVTKLPELLGEDPDSMLESDGVKKFAKRFLKAAEAEEEFEISGFGKSKKAKDEDEEDEDSEEEESDEESEDEEEEEEKPKKKKGKDKKDKKSKKKKAKDDDEDDEEEEGDEDEEEEKPKKKKGKKSKDEDEEDENSDEEEKPKKKKKPIKRAGGESGPGIIKSIQEFVEAASEDKPITKKAILAKLLKRFPDRDEEAMGKTVAVQVPNRLRNDKGLNVQKDEDTGGYWIAEGKPKKGKKPKKEEKKGKKPKKEEKKGKKKKQHEEEE